MHIETLPLGRLSFLHAPEPFEGRWRDDQLIASVRARGILQPLVVAPCGHRFLVVDGERRFLAAGVLGLATLPCLVLPESDLDGLERLRFEMSECLKRWDETDFRRWLRRKRGEHAAGAGGR
jgi:hypothetical protein